MNNTVLVTGATGFIGSHVCEVLSPKFNVVAVSSPFSNADRLNHLKNKIKIVKADLSNTEIVNKLVKKFKPMSIIHLATHGVYTYQQSDTERIIIDNYLMAVNLLEASVKNNVKKFINTGSVFEYGSQNKKVNENEVLLNDILNPYSAVKMATTALVNSYSDKMSVITLRPFTTYGPGEDSTRFIRATIERALKNEPMSIAGNVVRDFVYVEDVANAFYKALIKDYKSGEVINIASGKKETLDSIARKIKKITYSGSRIIIDKKYKRKKESACWADISKAKKVLSWFPKYNLDKGLTKTVDFLKK